MRAPRSWLIDYFNEWQVCMIPLVRCAFGMNGQRVAAVGRTVDISARAGFNDA